jgi:hypothetical protein
MSNEPLYELTSQLAAINNQLVESGGELTAEIEREFDALNLSIEAKANALARWCSNLKTTVAGIDAEIDRLKARKTARENLENRLKTYLLDCMRKADIGKIEGTLFNISRVSSPPSVEIEDETAIPSQFLTLVPEVWKVDKIKVGAALKEGKTVAGAKLITNKEHLRIK